MFMTTTLQDFQRTMRDEPLFNIYKHRFWLQHDLIAMDEVLGWLRKRYTETRTKNRYRIYTYPHVDGNRYVDRILLENVTDKDFMYMKLRWGWSEQKVSRGERVPRLKLTKDQRVIRDAIVKRALADFYSTLA
jgi:hypothetical protein